MGPTYLTRDDLLSNGHPYDHHDHEHALEEDEAFSLAVGLWAVGGAILLSGIVAGASAIILYRVIFRRWARGPE